MAPGARSHTYVLALQTRVIQSVAEEGFSGSESIAVPPGRGLDDWTIITQKENRSALGGQLPIFPSSVVSKVVVTLPSRFFLYGYYKVARNTKAARCQDYTVTCTKPQRILRLRLIRT